jgi:hypothetical protein
MSVIADFQVSGANPSTVGGPGSQPKYFPRVLGGSIGNFSLAPSATNAAGQLAVPAFGEVHGSIFKVKAGGDVLPFTGGGTVTIDLVANTGSVSSPNYAAIASTGAVTIATATPFNWFLEATLIGNNNTGSLGGNFWGSMAGASPALIDVSSIITQPTGLDFIKGQSSAGSQGTVLGLVVRVTFNVSLAQNFARLTQFVISD